jgi:hypothetical protein
MIIHIKCRARQVSMASIKIRVRSSERYDGVFNAPHRAFLRVSSNTYKMQS